MSGVLAAPRVESIGLFPEPWMERNSFGKTAGLELGQAGLLGGATCWMLTSNGAAQMWPAVERQCEQIDYRFRSHGAIRDEIIAMLLVEADG